MLNDGNESYGIIGPSEHWLLPYESDELAIANYRVSAHFSRAKGYGASMLLTRNNIDFQKVADIDKLSVEKVCEVSAISVPSLNVIVVSIYRSPSSDFQLFLCTFCNIVNQIRSKDVNVVIGGDFNVAFSPLDKTGLICVI